MSLGIQTQQVPNFSPKQMKLFRKLLGGVNQGGGLQAGLGRLNRLASGSQEEMAAQEAPAYADFQKALGDVGSRFAGFGALGSSAFQNATAGEAGKFAQDLQAKRMGIQDDALKRLLGLSGDLLGQRPYANFYDQEDEGFDWGSLLSGIGGLAGAYFGGPVGAGIGSSAGSGIGNFFGSGNSNRSPGRF